MKKHFLMFAICGVILYLNNVQVVAAELPGYEVTSSTGDVLPYMTHITGAKCSLSISNSAIADLSSTVRGIQDTVTRVVIVANLQQYKDGQWITLQTFTKEADSYMVTLSESYKVSKGYTYRVSANVRAYTSSSSEGRTVVSKEVTY